MEPPSATEYGPELSRDYRGLRLWLPLMVHGAAAFRSALTEKLELAQLAHEEREELISRGAALETVASPQLSIGAFRLKRAPNEPLGEWNARNALLNGAINARERVYLSSTALPVDDGMAFTLRTCIISFRTHSSRVEAFLEDLESALEEPGLRARPG